MQSTGGFLYPAQEEAVQKIKNGSVLNGGVGSGKSRTSLYYYMSQCGGYVDSERVLYPMTNSIPLYIITTAQKRDKKEWEMECLPFRFKPVAIDSWNNIGKYTNVSKAFFIFDEDRICGKGAWSKSFLKITKNNKWILLSATPGDDWEQYLTIFRANNFFRTNKEFYDNHVVWNPHTPYPKIMRYFDEDVLYRLRESILVDMDVPRHTKRIYEDVICEYDSDKYKIALEDRWDVYKDCPIETPSVLCYILRRIVNEDNSRISSLVKLLQEHPKAIIFYSYDYEVEQLRRGLGEALPEFEVAEYNGHKHEKLPEGDKWAYLVNYSSGAEGWNCIKTDTIIFYSQTYSWKTYEQACGRIDRVNTKFTDLYYYNLISKAPIDCVIKRALKTKKIFNTFRYGEKLMT